MDETTKQARTWGMLCHLTALVGLMGVPFGNILGPLIVWLVKKEEFPLVDQQGKESLNFQISLTLYAIISTFLIIVAVGIFMLIALFFFYFIMVVIASIRVSNGEPFRYPLTIRFLV